MRRRVLSTATALAVLAGSAALSVAVSGTAVADSATALGVRTVADIAVDGVHKRVYLSAPQDDAVVVTDYSGTELRRITGLDGVSGLALSADSGRLYAAVTNTDTIAAIDTTGASEPTSYALDGADAPLDLAVSGSTVWFSYGPSGDGALGSLDPAKETPAVTLDQAAFSFYGAPVIAVSQDGTKLAAGERETSGGVVAVYDLAGTTATQRVLKGLDGSFYDQLAFSPDGTQLVTASGYPYEHPAYSTTDLSRVHTYPSGDYGAGVAISPSGTVAAGTDSWYKDDLHIFRQGGTEAIRAYEFGNTSTTSGGDTLIDGVLSWSPDGSTLFAVSDNYDGKIRFHAYTDPDRTAPTLTVDAPATAPRAKPLKVTGAISSAVPFAGPVELTVTRTDPDNPSGKVLKTVTAAADGSYSFTDTPPAGGKVTYKVDYAGDADHAAAAGASDTVDVSRSATTLTLDKNKNVYAYGSDVRFTAHLGTTYKNRTVEIYADPYGTDKPKKLVKSGTVNASGDLSVSLDLTRDVTLSAVYAGDAHYEPKTVTNTVYTRARASVALSGHYKTGTIGSHKYAYYHKNAKVYATTSMNYYKGRKFRLDLQVYSGGAWQSADSEYFGLGSNGTTKVDLGAIGSAGHKFRIRSVYVDGSSGDIVNSTNYSGWKYLYSTN